MLYEDRHVLGDEEGCYDSGWNKGFELLSDVVCTFFVTRFHEVQLPLRTKVLWF